jgi:hypothetical protein
LFKKSKRKKFSLEVVPPEGMSNKSWFSPTGHRLWYYHSPRILPSPPDPEHVESTLDPQLRNLYDVLTSRGCVTKPSCAGHHRSKQDARDIFSALSSDARKIRGNGLSLTDIETGKDFLHTDGGWSLPWKTSDDLHTCLRGAGTGYIGFSSPEEIVEPIFSSFKMLLSLLPALDFELKDGTDFDLQVAGRDQEENDETWSILADELDSLI